MASSSQQILNDPTWLFELSMPVYRFDNSGDPKKLGGWELTSGFEQPRFFDLCDEVPIADAMLGWSLDGIFLQLDVRGKSPIRAARHAVAIEFFVDTRRSPGVHRATEYCHRFVFLEELVNSRVPEGRIMRMHGELTDIPRAKDTPPDVHPNDLYASITALDRDGYSLRAFLSKDVLNGFDPDEFPDLGLHYRLHDSVRGDQLLSRSSSGFKPDDPSIWCRGKLSGPPAIV